MAAPPSFPPGTKPPLPQPPRIPPYQPPSTPEEVAREKERIALLLEINCALIQHTATLQQQGQGGVLGSQQQQPDAGPEARTASDEYVKCMRCLSCNISYLTSAAQGTRGRPGTMAGPAIMDPPDALPGLNAQYEKLRALFPGWNGLAGAAAARGVGGAGAGGGGGAAQVSGHGQSAAVYGGASGVGNVQAR